MKKEPQPNASPNRQDQPKARVPFFAQHLKRETLRTIQGGDDMEKKPAQEYTSKA